MTLLEKLFKLQIYAFYMKDVVRPSFLFNKEVIRFRFEHTDATLSATTLYTYCPPLLSLAARIVIEMSIFKILLCYNLKVV